MVILRLCALLLISVVGLPSIYGQQGFVARHNIPPGRPIPSGFVRASELANVDRSSVPLNGPVRPLGQLPVAQDVAPVSASNQASAPKDPFQSSASQPQPQPKQGEPSPEQIQALIDSQKQLPKGPVEPVGPVGPVAPAPQVDPQLLAAMQAQAQPQPQPQRIVYVPVPVQPSQAVVAPAPATPVPAANLPSWMTNPLSGNLPWNG